MRADILLIACIFPRPYGARKNTMQLAKYPRVLYVKPSNKVYIFKAWDWKVNLVDDIEEKCVLTDHMSN